VPCRPTGSSLQTATRRGETGNPSKRQAGRQLVPACYAPFIYAQDPSLRGQAAERISGSRVQNGRARPMRQMRSAELPCRLERARLARESIAVAFPALAAPSNPCAVIYHSGCAVGSAATPAKNSIARTLPLSAAGLSAPTTDERRRKYRSGSRSGSNACSLPVTATLAQRLHRKSLKGLYARSAHQWRIERSHAPLTAPQRQAP